MRIRLVLCLLLCLAVSPTCAESPRVIVVLCDDLSLDDCRATSLPALVRLTETGAVGLMTCAVPNPRTNTAGALTLAAGVQSAAAPTDEQSADFDESVPGEPDCAGIVFARRTGSNPHPPPLFLGAGEFAKRRGPVPGRGWGRVCALGIASLTRRGLAPALLGAALQAARPDLRCAVFGNADTDRRERRAALLAMSAAGQCDGSLGILRRIGDRPYGLADDPVTLALSAAESNDALIVVQLGDLARAESARGRLGERNYSAARTEALRELNLFLLCLFAELERPGARPTDLLLISPRPPVQPGFAAGWERPTPILALGPHFSAGLLTSETTRTQGLVSNSDVAPTILALFGVAPPPAMVGRPMASHPVASMPNRLATLSRTDFVAQLNARVEAPFMFSFGMFGLAVFIVTLALRRAGRADLTRRYSLFWVWCLSMPGATLLAPILVPPTLIEYALRIAAWMFALALLAWLAARILRVSPLIASAAITTLLVLAATVPPQTMLKDACLSGYVVSGIRFYGIGNEFLGILLGLLLTASFAWLDDSGEQASGPVSRARRTALLAIWIPVGLVCGWPGLGANAGSLIATSAGFGIGWLMLCGLRPKLWHWLAAVATGLALAFAFGALDAALSPHGAASHAGAAIQASVRGRGASYLVEIAARKVGMNAALFHAPWTLFAGGLLIAVSAVSWAALKGTIQDVLSRRPWTARGLTAVAAAGIASLIFKDSGVVSLAFLAGAAFVSLVYCIANEPADDAGSSARA